MDFIASCLIFPNKHETKHTYYLVWLLLTLSIHDTDQYIFVNLNYVLK